MNQPNSRGIGFIELGISYSRGAQFLGDGLEEKRLRLSHSAPVDYLFAHALELMLKGCLLEYDQRFEVETFGHDLIRLYDLAKEQDALGGRILSVEKAVRTRWQHHLRGARDKHKADLESWLVSAELESKFGVHDNETIGRELPELRQQIIWLSDRHKGKGGKFRYLQPGRDNRERIQAFGLSDDVVRQSVFWACEEIYDCFREFKHNAGN